VKDGSSAMPDEETRSIMEAQSERLYGETRATLTGLKGLTEHLTECLLHAGEMSLAEALAEIQRYEGSDAAHQHHSSHARVLLPADKGSRRTDPTRPWQGSPLLASSADYAAPSASDRG
jgi:hypothetical protein